jgi:hypothetical protein
MQMDALEPLHPGVRSCIRSGVPRSWTRVGAPCDDGRCSGGITEPESDRALPDAEADALIAAVDEGPAMLEDSPSGAPGAP